MTTEAREPAWTGTLGLGTHSMATFVASFGNHRAPVTLHNGRSLTVGYNLFSHTFDLTIGTDTPVHVIRPRSSWWQRLYDITMAAPEPVTLATGWLSWKITLGRETKALCFQFNGRHRRFGIGEMVFAHFDYKSHLKFRCPEAFIPTAAVMGHILLNGSAWKD